MYNISFCNCSAKQQMKSKEYSEGTWEEKSQEQHPEEKWKDSKLQYLAILYFSFKSRLGATTAGNIGMISSGGRDM